MDKALEEKIVDGLVKQRAAQFVFLKELVKLKTVPSPPAPPPKTKDKRRPRRQKDPVLVLLESMGFEPELHAPPEDLIAERGRAPFNNFIIREKFGEGPTLALVSHIDTVKPTDSWSRDPFSGHIKDGVLFGLGAVSGKGHLTAHLFALKTLKDIGAALNGTVELHISMDGESGGALGAKRMLADDAVKPDMVIAGGPARAVGAQSTGTMTMEVEVRGSGAPAFAPEKGNDALEAASHAISRLYQFRNGLKSHASETPGIGAPTLVIERIEGGADGDGVPDLVKFSLDRRILPDEDLAQVESQLTKLIGSTIAKSQGVRCRIRRTSLIPAMRESESTANMREILGRRLVSRLPEVPDAHGIQFDHEGRHYAAAGIPTVMYGAGPLDPVAAGLHGADEHLVLDDLRLATEVLTLGIIDLMQA